MSSGEFVQAALTQGRVHSQKQRRGVLRGRIGKLQKRMQESMRQLYAQLERPAFGQVDTDDWEESTVCVCCNTNVYPKKLGPFGYCQDCLNDAAEGDYEYDPLEGCCDICGKYRPRELDMDYLCRACKQEEPT